VRPRIVLFALCLSALTAGCASLDQRFAQVQADTTVQPLNAWATSASSLHVTKATATDLAAWWHQLGDAQLEQLIDTATRAAPDVRAAQARLRQARATRGLAVANLYPAIGASAGGGDQSQSLYAAGFDASWEPSIFGGLRDAAEAARADAAAAEASLESTRASLAAEVALEYVTLRVSQQRLAIVRANVASQTETLQITEWRELAGLTTRLDVEQARTNLEQSRAAIPSLETARAEAEHRLAILTGRAPGSLTKLLLAFRPTPCANDPMCAPPSSPCAPKLPARQKRKPIAIRA
jgi:outer membrane protein TolC